jgi:alkylation response protein AidB-like acyl-CoA dehydrogenase
MAFQHQRQLDSAAGVAAVHAIATDGGTFPDPVIRALGDSGLLGLVSAREVGGQGADLAAAAIVVERLARECGSSAMIVCMHYCATAVIEAHGPRDVRQAIAAGTHLSTLAFSEVGSRSHFWAPLGTAALAGDDVQLDARKSWITAARHADTYVWSSRALAGADRSTLWLVPRRRPGLRVADAAFDGLGLRGNDSSPVVAERVLLPASARLGADGAGSDLMLGSVLPWFNVLSTAVSAGLMEAAVQKTVAHVTSTRLEHAGTTLTDLPTIRAYVARMRIQTDQIHALLADTLAAITSARPDATLRVFESKAAAGEAATQVTDVAMRVCGGAAFRKEVGVERIFRDARAALVMAPTTDVLYDFIGKAVCGLPLF